MESKFKGAAKTFSVSQIETTFLDGGEKGAGHISAREFKPSSPYGCWAGCKRMRVWNVFIPGEVCVPTGEDIRALELEFFGNREVAIGRHEAFGLVAILQDKNSNGKSISVWVAPAKEITKAGQEGLVSNLCMLCGSEAEKTGTNGLGEDMFKCSMAWCGVEFKETSIMPELIECKFEVDVEYCIELPDGLTFDFVVKFKDECSVSILVSKGLTITGILLLNYGATECFRVPECVSNHTEIRVYPYCRRGEHEAG